MTTVAVEGTRRGAERPVGREAVRQAVIDAAAALFAARGLAAVSIRDVAARAGVNHGLLHRHFGAKEQLVREVMDALAAGLARDLDADAVVRGEAAEALLHVVDSPYFRLLAHALLEGHDPGTLQAGFPAVGRFVEAAAQQRRDGTLPADVDPRVLVALGVAAGLGWILFEPFLLVATGLGRRAAPRLRAEALALSTRLVRDALGPRAGGRRRR